MLIMVCIKYHLLAIKMQVQAIKSAWPYLQACCSDAVLVEEFVVQHKFKRLWVSSRFTDGDGRGTSSFHCPAGAQKHFNYTRVIPLDKPDYFHLNPAFKELIHSLAYHRPPEQPESQVVSLVIYLRKLVKIIAHIFLKRLYLRIPGPINLALHQIHKNRNW